MNDKVTLRDIYNRFDRFEDRMDVKFRDFDKRVNYLEDFTSKASVYMTLLISGITVGVNIFWKRLFGE
jgi:hypothetical protein